MVVDERLLGKARAAGEKLGAAEREVELARAEYHTAIRRMHLAGGSLREIAVALELSHQRVQQIVEAAGGSWWTRVWRSRNARRDAVCTFCERPPSEVAKLISGPNVYICDGCVTRVEAVLAGQARAGETFHAVSHRARESCSFCGQKASKVRLVLGDEENICSGCIEFCREILNEPERKR